MSDEDDSMSEGFSASEDEWRPSKDVKGGESSDDDDSDFEGSPLAGAVSGCSATNAGRKRVEPKARSATKQTSSKRRTGLSLRTKLYNKYRPPPRTFSPPSSLIGKNSPSASTSCTNSKNATTPNESKSIKRKTKDGEDSGSSSDSSIDNYLINPQELDIQSSFFNVESKIAERSSVSPAPVFDCNAGLNNLSDSASDNEEKDTKGNEKAFDFNNLLQYAKNLELAKESVAKHNAEESIKKSSTAKNIDTLDVYAVLALGEKKQSRSHNEGDEDDEYDVDNMENCIKNQRSKLSKTKSARIKRHTKTRPSSIAVANDTDESDWEEVADTLKCTDTSNDISQVGNLEIHIELPSRNREKKTKTKQELEMAFQRKLNRDIRERQILMHKSSLLCHFGRLLFYNRLLNDPILMNNALKLLPSQESYPPGRGTEVKYFQSMVNWFKNSIKLKSQNLYPDKLAAKTKAKAQIELLKQIEEKEARSKQDMIFIFIILLRGMGLQCRLVVNIQPLPLKPAQSDLITFKMKPEGGSGNVKPSLPLKSINTQGQEVDNENNVEHKTTSSKAIVTNSDAINKNTKNNMVKKSSKNCSEDSTSNIDNKAFENTKALKDEQTKPTKTKRVEKQLSKENQKEVKEKFEKKSIRKNRDINKCSESCYNTTTQAKRVSNENGSKPKTRSKSTKKDIQESYNSSKENSELYPKIDKEVENNSNSTQNPDKSIKQTPALARLKRMKTTDIKNAQNQKSNMKPTIEAGSSVVPKIFIQAATCDNHADEPTTSQEVRKIRSRSKSPQAHISSAFLLENKYYKDKFRGIIQQNSNVKHKVVRAKGGTTDKVKISTEFLKNSQSTDVQKRVLRSRQKANDTPAPGNGESRMHIEVPQLDGANDINEDESVVDGDHKLIKSKQDKKKFPNIKKLKAKCHIHNSDEDFEPPPPKKPKQAPITGKKDRRVPPSDEDEGSSVEKGKRKQTAGDMWIEVWCDMEEQWVCVDIFKCKLHCIDTIRKSASSNLAYVFAFQNDLSIKDVTARYCPNWATVIRKSRADKAWVDTLISKYLGHNTKRDIKEDLELRRIHEEKPMPTAISDYKNHPFYALERHLLKFEAIYPPDAPTLGYVRGEPVYSRDCVHTLHSRDIWLKQARTVKLGEKPYKIVKSRPKWDRFTQTVIKDQPLEIFGYWQTQDYEPPTAENGLVPRNAYGNVELFQPSMLPKKTVHLRLPGLFRICKKLGVDCANAVVGFDFHQGACHPTYDGFIVCEEFQDQVIAAWHQDQEEQGRKDQEKYEVRVYGNWKKLIRGLLIRERLKLKYNF